MFGQTLPAKSKPWHHDLTDKQVTWVMHKAQGEHMSLRAVLQDWEPPPDSQIDDDIFERISAQSLKWLRQGRPRKQAA